MRAVNARRAGDDHPRDSLEVGDETDFAPIRKQWLYLRTLSRADFHQKPAIRAQPPRGLRNQPLVDLQPRRPGE